MVSCMYTNVSASAHPAFIKEYSCAFVFFQMSELYLKRLEMLTRVARVSVVARRQTSVSIYLSVCVALLLGSKPPLLVLSVSGMRA